MSARDQYRPKFGEEDAVRIAGALFGVEVSAKELPSERDRNFLLRAVSGEEYVLKIAAASEKREILEFQNQAMAHLLRKGGARMCPQVVASLTGEWIATVEDAQGIPHFVRLLTYLPGKEFADVNPHSEELLHGLGVFLGLLSRALEHFSHPATRRDLYWDLKNASSTIKRYKASINSPEKLAIVEHYLENFERRVLPALPRLRTSVIHNDGNDHNIIVEPAFPLGNSRFGILDFGDMVYSHTVFELAVAAAYAILGKTDPVAAAASVLRGYHSVFPLTELEIELLFPLLCARLAMSVAISAYQKQLEPDNEYLTISETAAWDTLYRLRAIHPRFAAYAFRHACNLVPCPQSNQIADWLKANRTLIGPVLDLQTDSVVLDLSVSSPEYDNPTQISDATTLTKLVSARIAAAGAKVGIGRYNEARLLYAADRVPTKELNEQRTIHLGMELFAEAGTPALAPLDGRIHSFQENPGPLGNGPTLILEHDIGDGALQFFTLYAHLSKDSLQGLTPGKRIKKGDKIAKIGNYPTNGGWPSSLHFQLIADMFDAKGDFPSLALPNQRETWVSICPDPNAILGIPAERFPASEMSWEEILAARSKSIGKSLSISYKKPLKVVRGYMQYLYDDAGRSYLDARNNVPHVGHCHPEVVQALRRQAGVLNTNTRYLHENLVKYAQRLCATLPAPLRVCFFVNSGSEANELALRMARTYTGESDVIVIEGAYHGNTGTMIEISPYKFDGPGGKGAPPYVHKVRMPDTYRGEFKTSDPDAGKKYASDVLTVTRRLKEQGKSVAAFVCEPLMGTAGQIVFPNNYLREAFQHVRKAGGVCIVDEVQVGFGRLGSHFWGFQTQHVVPDIVTMGKPIGNGHPLAAVVTTPEIADVFNNGMEFFSTTGGNPVSCAVGMAVLDVIQEERLQENARKVGKHLLQRLKQLQDKHRLIGDVRGVGLFIGVELVSNRETLTPATKEAAYIVERMKDLGVLVSADGLFANVLLIKPPLVFTTENADSLVRVLDKVLSEDLLEPTPPREGNR